jgi:cell fate regulator YaaT (PSP1 superfamily)
MAKEQNLSLNPTKISGLCGRLMCCLTYENPVYHELRKGFPKIGKTVDYKNGKAKVIRHNLLGQRLTLRLQDGTEVETALSQINWDAPKKSKE